MATAGFGALALVAGSAAGIAAMTSTDTRVVNAVGSESAVVALPPQAPGGNAGLGVQGPGGPVAGELKAGGRQAGAPLAGQAQAGQVQPGQAQPGQAHAGQAQAGQEPDDGRSAPGEADRTATRSPRRTQPVDAPKPAGGADSPAAPAVHVERISETESIPFRTRLVRDPSLPRGSREIQTQGVPGERVLHYEVTFTGTTETSRRLIDSVVTREPQHRVVAFGNRGGGRDWQQGGGRHDRDGRDGRGPRGHRRECHLRIGSCVGLSRNAVCTDEGDPREESIIDGDLSLLNPADIDELELTLPCEDEGKQDEQDRAKQDRAKQDKAEDKVKDEGRKE
jgi:hypothetical protein